MERRTIQDCRCRKRASGICRSRKLLEKQPLTGENAACSMKFWPIWYAGCTAYFKQWHDDQNAERRSVCIYRESYYTGVNWWTRTEAVWDYRRGKSLIRATCFADDRWNCTSAGWTPGNIRFILKIEEAYAENQQPVLGSLRKAHQALWTSGKGIDLDKLERNYWQPAGISAELIRVSRMADQSYFKDGYAEIERQSSKYCGSKSYFHRIFNGSSI